MSREITFPPKAGAAPDLPGRGFIAATKFELAALRKAAPGGVAAPPILAGMTAMTLWPEREVFMAGPVLGAPMAVMALENLIRRGAREIIFMGLAGALTRDLDIGDLFIPSLGLSTEGTSAHYPVELRPHPKLYEKLLGIDGAVAGPVWSTDGLFRETEDLVAAQVAKGALTVDMECCGLLAAARFRGVSLAALLVVSDLVTDEGHQFGFGLPRFKNSLNRAAQLAWELWS